jgi:hypothetical protein
LTIVIIPKLQIQRKFQHFIFSIPLGLLNDGLDRDACLSQELPNLIIALANATTALHVPHLKANAAAAIAYGQLVGFVNPRVDLPLHNFYRRCSTNLGAIEQNNYEGSSPPPSSRQSHRSLDFDKDVPTTLALCRFVFIAYSHGHVQSSGQSMQPSLGQLEDGTKEIASAAAAAAALMLLILCRQSPSGLRDSVIISQLEAQVDRPVHHIEIRRNELVPTVRCSIGREAT